MEQEPRAVAIGEPAPAGEITVDAGTAPPAALVEELVGRGEGVLVTLKDVDGGPEDPGLLAAASVYAWLGVRVLRVPAARLADVRQVLDMVAAIRGTRRPEESRRGLA